MLLHQQRLSSPVPWPLKQSRMLAIRSAAFVAHALCSTLSLQPCRQMHAWNPTKYNNQPAPAVIAI